MAVLKVSNIAKKIKQRQILSDISLLVRSGDIVGLLGPNGAGKTSCFCMILGITTVDCGSILIDDVDLTFLSVHERARHGINYLPQEASIFRKLSVSDNIMAILETQKELGKSQRDREMERLLEEFRIGHIRNELGFSLSGGERRRVEIARALASFPKFILLDEPFAGIDPISMRDIKLMISGLSDRGLGILITDHNVRATLDICTNAYIVNGGKVIAAGVPDDIIENRIVKEVYLGDDFRL